MNISDIITASYIKVICESNDSTAENSEDVYELIDQLIAKRPEFKDVIDVLLMKLASYGRVDQEAKFVKMLTRYSTDSDLDIDEFDELMQEMEDFDIDFDAFDSLVSMKLLFTYHRVREIHMKALPSLLKQGFWICNTEFIDFIISTTLSEDMYNAIADVYEKMPANPEYALTPFIYKVIYHKKCPADAVKRIVSAISTKNSSITKDLPGIIQRVIYDRCRYKKMTDELSEFLFSIDHAINIVVTLIEKYHLSEHQMNTVIDEIEAGTMKFCSRHQGILTVRKLMYSDIIAESSLDKILSFVQHNDGFAGENFIYAIQTITNTKILEKIFDLSEYKTDIELSKNVHLPSDMPERLVQRYARSIGARDEIIANLKKTGLWNR
jgi:hypothetical protein